MSLLHTQKKSNPGNAGFPRSIQQSDATKAYNQSLAQKYGIPGIPDNFNF